ncbi:MAG: hypothetical protein V4582_02775 [Pseudomonadota bacterium]
MSKMVFDGQSHQLSLIDENGMVLGSWAAYNNVDRHATLTHVPNRTYQILDRSMPRQHAADANGPYGLHGIVRFEMPGHPGIGVHSGRASAVYRPGPEHPTQGCIRTSDDAMGVIVQTMRADPITTIEVINNNSGSAHAATVRNRNSPLHGRHG